MALFNLARMTVTGTPGTGTITLNAAVSGYLTFAQGGVTDGALVSYGIKDGTNSEAGIGTYTASGTTLARTRVINSTNSNNAVSLTSSAEVFITALAHDFAPNYRNILYANGGLEVWQRGAGGSASIAVAASTTAYCADRWYLKTGANQAFTVSQQAGLTTQSRWCGRVQRNSGQTGTSTVYFEYPLTTDECIALRGQFITLQLYTSTGANWSPTSGTLTINAYFGTGAEGKRNSVAYTGETNPLTTSVNLATSASAAQTRFTGASAVATNVTQGCLQFSWAPTGTASTNDWVSLDDVQLEAGSSATAFERISFAAAMVECQRHYCKTFPYATAPAQNAGLTGALYGLDNGNGAANGAAIGWQFPTSMRATPTLTLYNPSAANAQMRSVTTSFDLTATAASNVGTNGTGILATSTLSSSIANVAAIHAQADAGL